MSERLNLKQLSDQELLVKIRENIDALGIVYKACKFNSIRFMQKMTSGSVNEYELEDVLHDSVIILYEKIIGGDFKLTCALQTYINSVCRFQLLNKLGESKVSVDFNDNSDNDDDKFAYEVNIIDTLDELEDATDDKIKAIEKALEAIKNTRGHCYDLLTHFWYHRKSIRELTETFGYTNDVNTRVQKSKCQERLRVLSFNELNRI